MIVQGIQTGIAKTQVSRSNQIFLVNASLPPTPSDIQLQTLQVHRSYGVDDTG